MTRRKSKTQLLREQAQAEAVRRAADVMPGSVLVVFRRPLSDVGLWRRWFGGEAARTKLYHHSTYKVLDTQAETLLVVRTTTSFGPVDAIFNWRDVEKVAAYPRIEPDTSAEAPEPALKKTL